MFRKKSNNKNYHKEDRHKEENFLRHIASEIESRLKSFEKKVENKIEDFSHELERETKIVVKKVKNKIAFFYKINFAIILTLSVVLAYFLILVSTTPKSFPFVTSEIREQLKKNYGDAVVFENAYISFTKYGTLKVSVNNLQIFGEKFISESQNDRQKQVFLIPKADAEFSILNLLHSSFIPRKIKISDPEINIDDSWKSDQNSDNKNSYRESLIKLLATVKKENLLTKSFEIENAKINILTSDGARNLLIKKMQLRALSQNETLYISTSNKLKIDDSESDLNLSSSCKFSKQDVLKCDISLINFVPKSVADLHEFLQPLSKINAIFDVGGSLVLDSQKLHNVTFKAESKAGNFFFPEFFGEKIFFSDFSAKAEYDSVLGILNLKEIKADLRMHDAADMANPNSMNFKTRFDMSLLLSNLNDWQNYHADFYIKLHDAPVNELEKLWPTFLHEEGIRDWVIQHLSNGLVRDAYARFSLVSSNNVSVLDKIDSELVFSEVDLKYSDDFPKIDNVSGSAKFTKQDMKINITSGDVLGSKIYDAKVNIDDFNAPTTLLHILGKSKGSASDSLKHADNSPKFSDKVEKYLNGDSQNDFDIRIPLHDNLSLKHSYISVNSAITGLKNEYVKGAMNVSVKKDFGQDDFVTKIELTKSELDLKDFNIEKKLGVESTLTLDIAFPEPKTIALKNISLWKKVNVVLHNKNQTVTSKINGNFKADIAPFNITSINLKNENFGRNSYVLNYSTDKKSSLQKLLIRGQVLDLAPAIHSKFSGFSSDNSGFKNSIVQISLDNLLLDNSKAVKSFSLAVKCRDHFCYNGSLKGSYNKRGQSLELQLNQKPQEDFARLEGQITDVGYMAEALGISKVVAGGNAHLKLQHKLIDKKPTLEGLITFDDSIVIYENQTVKRLATNSLFSKVRDKIFSEDKTIFDSVKLEFSLKDSVIDVKSLVANNYKIGITAKGQFDLKNDSCQIKGMIVPGFIINNLFGIGNIPIIGNVVGLLTGGEGGGVFGIRYEYTKKKTDKEPTFETNKVSSFVPTTIKNLFDLI